MKTEYAVFWIDDSGDPRAEKFTDMNEALIVTEYLRKQPKNSFITMCGENPNQVGKAGVDSVENGKTPDGVEYSWTKRRDL